MRNSQTSPWQNLSRDDVRRLVQFYDPEKNEKLNDLQTEGCYHLWNTLTNPDLRFAYLADEVGMGKTYQALGVMALLHYLKPGAKMVILCPGREMQKQWSSDWHSFFQDKFCPDGIDGNLKGCRIDDNGKENFESRIQPQICENINEFAAHLVASQHSVYLLRYPSFSLPIRVFEWSAFVEDKDTKVSLESLLPDFRKVMDSIGCHVNDHDVSFAINNSSSSLNLEQASTLFLSIYTKKIAKLLEVFSPDLVVWDEAQYLRTDATRNNSMRTIFGNKLYQKGCRHLFLSATPAHRDVSDIEQLNHLLAHKDRWEKRPIIITQGDSKGDEFRRSVSPWMVRRERSFNGFGKQQYREFKETPIDMFSQNRSPMYALTFAATQKKLVELLEGQNNKFRLGEISCYESARSSIESAKIKPAGKSKNEIDSILEETSGKKESEPIDEKYLEKLGKSFKSIQQVGDENTRLGLPHAKIDEVVDDLARRCLANGSTTKELVFVRRVATVDELADRLLHEFQYILNHRISLLGELPQVYWKLPPEAGDDADEDNSEEVLGLGDSIGLVKDLPYFKALSAVKGSIGRLTQYRNTLGKAESSTIRFLLVPSDAMSSDDNLLWQSLLSALGIFIDEDIYKPFREDTNKELLLRRCIGHSIRFTDILVDLDVLRRENRGGYVSLWISMLANPKIELEEYFTNTRLKLRNWIIHFDTIVNKCFKGGGSNNSNAEIAERVSNYFGGMSPVARRSGRRKDENVVPQFKFPVFPNVLVCTDVLREGVNLHLFCERISHYGIAWNSGDLEQRIGRVERADSLFERKILADDSHKLHVGFPYLARTLDERQVKKAIQRKKAIDALFSIVPPLETGECDDSKEVVLGKRHANRSFEPILPSTPLYPTIGTQWSNANASMHQQWSVALRKAHEIASGYPSGHFKYTACRMIGEFGLLAIEWVSFSKSKNAAWNVCDKLVFDTFDRKKQWKAIRTLYMPVDCDPTKTLLQDFWSTAEKTISGSSANDNYSGFHHCSYRNTHIKAHRIPHPVEIDENRNQVSHICRWGEHVALTSFVGSVEEMLVAADSADSIASRINKHLPIGCATIIDNQLVLSFPIIHIGVWKEETIGSIALLLAHWADRHQWKFLNVDDDEIYNYRVQVSGVCEMNTKDAIDVLSSIREWCDDLNDAIEKELGEPADWKISSFDKMVKSGMVSSITQVLTFPGFGKYQIGYSLTRLNDDPETKEIRIYLSGKRAHVRVVSNDMEDISGSMTGDYESWLERNGYGTDLSSEETSPHFHYAYADHKDGTQYRRVRIVLNAAELEPYGNRDKWVLYIVKLATSQLLNEVFQYNAAKNKVDAFLNSRDNNIW